MPMRRPSIANCACRLGVVLTLALAANAVLAAPDVDPVYDPLGKFLTDTGLSQSVKTIANAPSAAASAATAATAMPSAFAGKIREQASDMVIAAMNFIGVKYRRGGNDADAGFDCSGFTRRVFEHIGVALPRRVDDQAKAPGLVAVKRDELQPGDLVFFNTLKRTFSHVGIYVGEGKFIHSPKPGGEVRVEDMGYAYWKKRFTGARRAESAAAPAATLSTVVVPEASLAPNGAGALASASTHPL